MDRVVTSPSEQELAIINTHFAKRPMTADELYIFPARLGDSKTVTDYYSTLDPSTLSNFVQDIMARYTQPDESMINFHFNHLTGIGAGTLFHAKVEQGASREQIAKGLVYMPKGLSAGAYLAGAMSTDDYILALESGTTEDLSVGFGEADQYICSICQNDIRGCGHYPGEWYNVGTEKNPDPQQCIYRVVGAHLFEVSAVWRAALKGSKATSTYSTTIQGARPSQKVSINIKDFALDDILYFNLSFHGSIECFGKRLSTVEGNQQHTEGDSAVSEIEEGETPKEISDVLDTELAAERLKNQDLINQVLTLEATIAGLEEQMRTIKAEMSARAPEIEIGRKYRERLDRELTHWIVKLEGNEVDLEIFTKKIGALSVEEKEKELEAIQEKAIKRFGVGQRSENPQLPAPSIPTKEGGTIRVDLSRMNRI